MNHEPLIVRYQLLCDDRSGDPRDEFRVAELVCSLTSLKLYVHPSLALNVLIYTLPAYSERLCQILCMFDFASSSILNTAPLENEAFAASIVHCTPVDRICIRRMLADFSLLPANAFRLLLGTDIIFLRPPVELIEFVQGPIGEGVLYMVDNTSFEGELYRLTYHEGPILAGLLGDFYCLAPGVKLDRAAIESCLQNIDAWPPAARWTPQPRSTPLEYTHACEQQAAAILLADYSSYKLPEEKYLHVDVRKIDRKLREFTVLHIHDPWTLLRRNALPPALGRELRKNWRALGMTQVLKRTTWLWIVFHLWPRLLLRPLKPLAAKLGIRLAGKTAKIGRVE